MQSPDTFIAMTTRWGSDYPDALSRARTEFIARYGKEPSVVMLNPDVSDDVWGELAHEHVGGKPGMLMGMKIVRKRSVPPGEVWVG